MIKLYSVKRFYSLTLCFATFKQIPIADIKTISEVLPALMKGNGKPVGEIIPFNTSYCYSKHL